MKAYTDVLINKVEGGSKWYKADPYLALKHYEAKHKTEDIYIMWMETKMMRRRCALPCVLAEDGDALVFKASKSIAVAQENADILKRWSLIVTPENILTDWDVNELEQEEFSKKYKMIQNGELYGKKEEADETEETEENDITE